MCTDCAWGRRGMSYQKHETYDEAVAKLPKGVKPCDASSWNGNADDPDYAYCVAPRNHGGDHDFRITW